MNHPLRILCIAPAVPRPDRNAGDRRFFALLQMLAGKHTVDFYAQTPNDVDPELCRYEAMLRQAGVNVCLDRWRGLEQVLARRVYNVGLFEFWHCAEWAMPPFRSWQPWARMVVDSVDVHFAREEAGIALEVFQPDEVAARKQRELDVYNAADSVIAISVHDRQHLEMNGMSKLVTVVPIIIPTRIRRERVRRKELLFVGGFSHQPNVDGVLWFAKEILPGIRSRVPDVHLTVVGSQPPPNILRLGEMDGVDVLGFRDSVDPHLDRAAISVAPLRYGGGMKGKVVEAMAAGVPVVTTSVGVQGLQVVSGHHAMVADTPAEFADAVITLICEPTRAEQMGRLGQEYIATICGPDVVQRHLRTVLSSHKTDRPMDLGSWRLRSAALRLEAGGRTLRRRLGLNTLRTALMKRKAKPGHE